MKNRNTEKSLSEYLVFLCQFKPIILDNYMKDNRKQLVINTLYEIL